MTQFPPCGDNSSKIGNGDDTQQVISVEPDIRHKNITQIASGPSLLQFAKNTPLRTEQNRFLNHKRPSLVGLPKEVLFILSQYLDPSDGRNARHTCLELYGKLSGFNQHIIIEEPEVLPYALIFFARMKHYKLTLKVTRFSADDLPLLERLQQINWEELDSDKLDAPTSAYGVRELDLSNTNINDEGLTIILKYAPFLTSLNLSGCKNFSKGMLIALLNLA